MLPRMSAPVATSARRPSSSFCTRSKKLSGPSNFSFTSFARHEPVEPRWITGPFHEAGTSSTTTGRRPRRIVDLGCGSGILALAAARLFPAAQRIVAVDNDPEATETTRENAEHNQLGERLEIFTGTALELGDDFDLILANIRPSVLIPIADQLARRLAPGGLVMLSGILGEEA